MIGFGAKAGFVPFHVWLPEAHPAAPSHVSALMSGVMIKMGLYGLLRVVTFLGPPAPWWGLTLAALGLLTALVGVSLALYQRDMKRVLAYSSIENMGLIAPGARRGALRLGQRATPMVAVLGTAAGLLHIWNHALMKGLMFFAAGSVLHGDGHKGHGKARRSCEENAMDRRRHDGRGGGDLGAAALERLRQQVAHVLEPDEMRSGDQRRPRPDGPSGGRRARAGRRTGAGSRSCVSRASNALGRREAKPPVTPTSPRPGCSPRWRAWCSSAWRSAVVPQAGRATCSPGIFDQVLGRRAGHALLNLEPSRRGLSTLGAIDAWTLVALVATACRHRRAARGRPHGQGSDLGLRIPRADANACNTPGASFAEMIAEHLLPRVLRPRTTLRTPRAVVSSASEFGADRPDPISDKVYEPFFRRWAERFSRLRILQQGKVNVYLIYIVLMVVLALAWVSVRGYWSAS